MNNQNMSQIAKEAPIVEGGLDASIGAVGGATKRLVDLTERLHGVNMRTSGPTLHAGEVAGLADTPTPDAKLPRLAAMVNELHLQIDLVEAQLTTLEGSGL